MITFLFVPSTATRIFKTFACDSFETVAKEARPNLPLYSGDEMRYLQDDLSLPCDSATYGQTRALAVALVLIWPVGP
eukprot:5201764-Prymnesium_polylepis.1